MHSLEILMQKHIIYLSLTSLLVVISCSSPKNQFEKGNYEKAVELSIKKLQKKPSNTKQQAILKAAYTYAVQVSDQKIKQFSSSQNRFKWDQIIDQYQGMQQLYLSLLQCPGCLAVVTAVDYQDDLIAAQLQGAQVYVEEGIKALDQQTKEAGRNAYRLFAKAKMYHDTYAGIDQYLDQAKAQGSEIIGVSRIPVASKGLELNTAFFLQQLTQAMNTQGYTFATFIGLEELQANQQRPDQIVELSFDDYFVGQTYLKETRETVEKDSVEVGIVTDSLGAKKSVFGKVSADIQYFEKTIESGGLLNIAIIDPQRQSVVLQEKIPSTYVWENNWLLFQGDKRALTKKERKLSKQKELIPPPPQELFYAFTRPLFDHTVGVLRQRYRYLR